MAWVILALIAGAYFGAFVFACLVAWRDTHPKPPPGRPMHAEPLEWESATETQ